MKTEEERLELELEEAWRKFKDIMIEVNREIRRRTREFRSRKNVVPKKIILPGEYILRLREYRPFERCYKRKVCHRFIPEKGEWIRINLYPNLGGVPVEEGKRIEVQVVKLPRRRRRKKDEDPRGNP